jgi:hypothetical protein
LAISAEAEIDLAARGEAALAASAATPTVPMVNALGSVPCKACHTTVPMTHKPKTTIVAPFASAAKAR